MCEWIPFSHLHSILVVGLQQPGERTTIECNVWCSMNEPKWGKVKRSIIHWTSAHRVRRKIALWCRKISKAVALAVAAVVVVVFVYFSAFVVFLFIDFNTFKMDALTFSSIFFYFGFMYRRAHYIYWYVVEFSILQFVT